MHTLYMKYKRIITCNNLDTAGLTYQALVFKTGRCFPTHCFPKQHGYPERDFLSRQGKGLLERSVFPRMGIAVTNCIVVWKLLCV
jgi:hypothetical protein